ncbi:MAG: cytidylate kinase [Chitinophagaceae bacterium]|nr:(d)CMP kinase [Chitinophagaceae bacterium]MCZ2297922.1 (d)CMP kinase [Chitinophagales bacterium]
MNKIVIAIDGYSSCGKSTLAKQLANALNYVFVDSGAMYRAITLYFLRNKIDNDNPQAVQQALQNISLTFKFNAAKESSDMYLNNENVEDLIREMQVSQNVSKVSTLKDVRVFAVAQQQQMGIAKGVVMDGRDIGTAVFPDAELKIFVTATIDVRVERRLKEMVEKNINTTREEVKKNLEERDFIDSTRAISPLKKADDAIVLDNSFLTREEQLTIALQWANEKIYSN